MSPGLPDAVAQMVDTPTAEATNAVPILVVNDTEAQRIALRSVLAPLGHSIVEADSGLEALRCVMAQEFAVILLDVCMPEMDGFETAALIRQRQQSEMTPLIFITAYGSDEIPDADLYAEGAVDFIFAPVPPNELRAKVSVFANLFLRAQALAARAREVQASADEFWLLTDAAPIGIFQTDAQNRYVYTNPRWSEIMGIPPEEAAGRPWDVAISAETRAELIADFADPDLDRNELSCRIEIPVPGSASRIALLTAKTIRGGDGVIAGWVGTLADITAEAGAEAAMADARDKATEASRLKSDFLANMSHEIRTPMNGVLGMADLLLETNLDTRQRDYAQTVRNSGEALMTIINDILDFSKVEAGKLQIEEIEFDLRTIVDDVVQLLAGPAEAKHLELIAAVDQGVPAVIRGDPGRVRQVLTNLIGNAVKFTQAGEIILRVHEVAAPGDGTTIRFEVFDTGDGIAADKLAMVFQPFVQADTTTSRKYGGTGLGLAISSQLVSLMGGDCGVSSELGSGSAFWFTITVHADTDAPTHASLQPDTDLAGVRVLVVDDNATQRSVLTETLTAWGMVAIGAESGELALTAMRAAGGEDSTFPVALIDRAMPGMDGLALKDAMAADAALTTRIVLMTSFGEDRDVRPPAESGVAVSLPKPIHMADLLAAVRVALGFQVAETAPVDTTPSHPASLIEQRVGRLLLAEDNRINQKVAVAMLSSVGYEVDTVVNGAEAVAAAATRHYDAILMDCQMPEMNGYDATVAIRLREGPDEHVPIIAMTAGARREDRERCLAEGMDSYLAKPVSKDALLALVARSIKHAVVAPLPIRRAVVPEHTIDPVVFDDLQRLGESTKEGFVLEVVDRFVHDTEVLLLQLREAVGVGDALAVGRIVHSIKGSCSQLGGQRLAASCDRLETKANARTLANGDVDLEEVELDYQALRHELRQRVALATP
jgi:two-component system, sensor histidine kinase and response regulator